MSRDKYMIKKEMEMNKKLTAFRLFKELGLETAIQTYPNLQGFLTLNKHKDYKELERELYIHYQYAIETIH